MAKLTPVQNMRLGNVLEGMREQLEKQEMTTTEIVDLVAAEVDFNPPESSVLRMIEGLEIKLPTSPRPKSDVARLAALTVLLGRAKEGAAKKAVADLLLAGKIKEAYGARGPLVF